MVHHTLQMTVLGMGLALVVGFGNYAAAGEKSAQMRLDRAPELRTRPFRRNRART